MLEKNEENTSTKHEPNIDIAPKRRGRGPSKKVASLKEERITKVFFCTKGQYSFRIPVYERDGAGDIVMLNGKKKQLITTDANGNNPVAATETMIFDRFPVIDPKTNKTDATVNVSRFQVDADNPDYDDIVAAIEEGMTMPICGVITKDQYRKQMNHASYVAEEKAKSLEAANKEKDTEISKLKEMLKKQGVEV